MVIASDCSPKVFNLISVDRNAITFNIHCKQGGVKLLEQLKQWSKVIHNNTYYVPSF